MRILILESHAIGPLACIRSLGRAGHIVIATSRDPHALGFSSKYCNKSIIQPTGLTGASYEEWLRRTVAENRIELILPSEDLVTSLGERIEHFTKILPVGPTSRNLERFVSKFELFDHFLSASDIKLRQHLPVSMLVRSEQLPTPLQLESLPTPIFAKFDADALLGLESQVVRFDTPVAAISGLRAYMKSYPRALLQAYAPGQGVGVFFLRWNGKIVATLMHRRIHEVPHTGGVSSFRETWWNSAIYDDARRRIDSMDWWGVGMLEYRWDPTTGDFKLMEFNARFWGSLHLALFADIDFPRLLIEVWAGQQALPCQAVPGVKCRLTFPKEVEHLWSVLSDPKVAWMRKLGSAIEFGRLGLDPRIHSDLWYPGDTGVYWRAAFRTPGRFLRKR